MLAVQTPPSEKAQFQPVASLHKKGRFMEEPIRTLLHLYLSDIEITLIVLFRIEIIDASYCSGKNNHEYNAYPC